jgi:hypothetical protein
MKMYKKVYFKQSVTTPASGSMPLGLIEQHRMVCVVELVA